MWFDTLDSTQEEVKRRLEELDSPSVVAAMYQTAGKGQRGNKWSSASGENLTFSILLKPGQNGVPGISAAAQFDLSIISALAVKEFLESIGINCKIKWPNDVYAGNKKICGMLIENRLAPDGMLAHSIIGIGININQTAFPPQLVNPTSAALQLHRTFDIRPLLEDFMGIFLTNMNEYALGRADGLRKRFLESLYRLGQNHTYRDLASGIEFTGKIIGVGPDGRVIIELPDGNAKSFSFKEISYII